MNISSISSSSLNASTAASSSTTSTAQLKKQIQVLEQKIQALNASQDDPQTKAQKLQVYQSQLALLQLQLQQATTKTSSK